VGVKNVIYEPKGKAAEYAKYACNLYRGCGHGCLYCYAPDVLRMKRNEFHAKVEPRPGILEALEKEAPQYKGRFVHLCFTCDPYFYNTHHVRNVTSDAIRILHYAGVGVTILTKAGINASRDFFLLGEKPELSKFGVTLTCDNLKDSLYWERYADSPQQRFEALKLAKGRGISTWASCEPVVDPKQTLAMIRATASYVDEFKVGKLNYHPQAQVIEKEYGWDRFAAEVTDLLQKLNKKFVIKDDLAKYL
jgi:DNA repair photolyase